MRLGAKSAKKLQLKRLKNRNPDPVSEDPVQRSACQQFPGGAEMFRSSETGSGSDFRVIELRSVAQADGQTSPEDKRVNCSF